VCFAEGRIGQDEARCRQGPGGRQAEIALLQSALNRTKQEAGEHASRLEDEVKSGKAAIAVAMIQIQVLEEALGRKDAVITSLQEALDKKQEACEHSSHLNWSERWSRAKRQLPRQHEVYGHLRRT
jgi:hypothetical protein